MARNDDYYDGSDAESDETGAYDGVTAGSGQSSGDDVARATAASDPEMVYADGREADDSWLTSGLAWALLGSGVVLFLFPEPATSMVGIGLIVAGLAAWVLTRD